MTIVRVSDKEQPLPKNKDFETSFFHVFMATSKMLAMIKEEILKQSSNLLRIFYFFTYGVNTYNDYEIAHM